MFFFQDNIGLLIRLSSSNIWQWIFAPEAEHFEPLTHVFYLLEYSLFGLNFNYYLSVSIMLHLINLILLFFIIKKVTGNRLISLISTSFFAINLTYTEPILWVLHGLLISTFFISLSFYFWFDYVRKSEKRFYVYSFFTLILAAFSYGLGGGAGLIFAVINLIYPSKIKGKIQYSIGYAVIGLITLLIGPLINTYQFSRMVPVVNNGLFDLFKYLTFVIAGVSRGVIGRFFLPGFEPRHFEIIPTVISFIPVAVIFLITLFNIIRSKDIKRSYLFIILAILIIFPYVWAGVVRYHFGLKQSLAERYAYPSLFFFSIFLSLLLKQAPKNKIFKILIGIFLIFYLIFQSKNFYSKAVEFEKKPILTKKYFFDVGKLLSQSATVINLPLPSFIHQFYAISDLETFLKIPGERRYINADNNFCTKEITKELQKEEVQSFYLKQSEDSVVSQVIRKDDILSCLTKSKF